MSSKGWKHSAEALAKISAASKRAWSDGEYRKLQSECLSKRDVSAELKRYYREHPEALVKMAERSRGKAPIPAGWKHTDETRAKMRLSAVQRHKKPLEMERTHSRLEKARRSLRHVSALEDSFAAFLTVSQIDYERQFKLGGYSFDFMVRGLDLVGDLLIEVDGCYWHGCELCGFPGLPGNKRSDARKEDYARRHELALLRIPEHTLDERSRGYAF